MALAAALVALVAHCAEFKGDGDVEREAGAPLDGDSPAEASADAPNDVLALPDAPPDASAVKPFCVSQAPNAPRFCADFDTPEALDTLWESGKPMPNGLTTKGAPSLVTTKPDFVSAPFALLSRVTMTTGSQGRGWLSFRVPSAQASIDVRVQIKATPPPDPARLTVLQLIIAGTGAYVVSLDASETGSAVVLQPPTGGAKMITFEANTSKLTDTFHDVHLRQTGKQLLVAIDGKTMTNDDQGEFLPALPAACDVGLGGAALGPGEVLLDNLLVE